MLSGMKKPSQLAYLIRIQAPGAEPEFYATYADSAEHAGVLVSDKLQTTNESVDFEGVLTQGVAKQQGLTPDGGVKKIV